LFVTFLQVFRHRGKWRVNEKEKKTMTKKKKKKKKRRRKRRKRRRGDDKYRKENIASLMSLFFVPLLLLNLHCLRTLNQTFPVHEGLNHLHNALFYHLVEFTNY